MIFLLKNFYALLIISVAFNVTANILLKTSVTKSGGVIAESTKLIDSLLKVALNPLTIFGLALYGLSFLIWLRVLTFNDLSRAYPIFATIVFLMTTLGSIKFLNEDVSIVRIIGMSVMLVGIFIVSHS